MLEIAELKLKKLPELQEIAKGLGIKGITGQKKMDLAYSIIDHIASQPETKKEKQEDAIPKDTSKKTPKEQASKKPQINILGLMDFIFFEMPFAYRPGLPPICVIYIFISSHSNSNSSGKLNRIS